MKTAQQWDELLTCSPMNAKEALESVRIKPSEIEAIQADAQAHGERIGRISGLREASSMAESESKLYIPIHYQRLLRAFILSINREADRLEAEQRKEKGEK